MTLDFNLHLSAHTYFLIVVLITIWNLGFTSITRKGKLLYPLLAFFTKQKFVETKVLPEGNIKFDEEIDYDFNYKNTIPELSKAEFLKEYLSNSRTNPSNYYSKNSAEEIIDNLGIDNVYNQWYFKKGVDVFPDLIKDPLIVCITCMASVHGTMIYLLFCYYHHIAWNPIEQLAVSVPVAFLGEFFWKLKLKIEK